MARRTGRGAKAPGYFTTECLESGASFGVEISTKDQRHVERYLDAHCLLPYGFDLRVPSHRRLAVEALGVLADLEAGPLDVLRAIVVLGHAPSPEAVEALGRHGRSRRAFAGVARVALGECAGLLASATRGGAAA